MANEKTEITAEVEIDFPSGKKTIKMIMKDRYEIEDCDHGKVVMLNLKNGQTYNGTFEGVDGDDDIMLTSISGKQTIGLKINWIADYFEEITETE